MDASIPDHHHGHTHTTQSHTHTTENHRHTQAPHSHIYTDEWYDLEEKGYKTGTRNERWRQKVSNRETDSIGDKQVYIFQ